MITRPDPRSKPRSPVDVLPPVPRASNPQSLAGRSREPIEALGRELDLPTRVGLKEPQALERSLKDVDLVLHCAGHFARTSPPMLEACLTTGTHYLDITGEIAVFESIMHLDEEAKAVGVILLPGVGFDVVPMDCLAASLAEALTDGTHLDLAFSASDGSASRATLKTLIEAMPNAGGTLSVGLLRRPGPGGRDRQSALKGGLLWSMWYVGRLM